MWGNKARKEQQQRDEENVAGKREEESKVEAREVSDG